MEVEIAGRKLVGGMSWAGQNRTGKSLMCRESLELGTCWKAARDRKCA